MAVAHAKFTGQIGVCLSTGGPGATHMITGLYDAKLDHVPVLAICGQAEATVRGSSYQQELNLDRMFSDVACFVQEASSPAQVRHLIDRAMRIAIARNGVSAIILPKDIQDSDYEEPKVAHGFTRSGAGYSRPKIVPEAADLEKAAALLNAGTKVAILAGAGARGASGELLEAADLLGAGGLMKDRVDRLAQGTKSRARPARLGRRRCDSDVSAAPAQAASEAAE